MAKPGSRYLSFRLTVLLIVLLSMVNSALLVKTAYALPSDQPEIPVLLHLYPLTNAAMKVKAGGSLPCLASVAPPLCYSPQQIRQVYDIEPLVKGGIRGQGRRIIIISDYQSPTLLTDLTLFDKLFGLGEPKLSIVAPFGLHPFDSRNAGAVGFALEMALDVQWAHAIAPDATINLVLGNPSSDNLRGQVDGIIGATEYAVANNLG
ncbi:MAG TPA: hypothetical protein VFU49_12585, partial [Ktedonobacteraceae bacterium]|nr:hypothetical protein [Ktedonobacteraceae bacterium]